MLKYKMNKDQPVHLVVSLLFYGTELHYKSKFYKQQMHIETMY